MTEKSLEDYRNYLSSKKSTRGAIFSDSAIKVYAGDIFELMNQSRVVDPIDLTEDHLSSYMSRYKGRNLTLGRKSSSLKRFIEFLDGRGKLTIEGVAKLKKDLTVSQRGDRYEPVIIGDKQFYEGINLMRERTKREERKEFCLARAVLAASLFYLCGAKTAEVQFLKTKDLTVSGDGNGSVVLGDERKREIYFYADHKLLPEVRDYEKLVYDLKEVKDTENDFLFVRDRDGEGPINDIVLRKSIRIAVKGTILEGIVTAPNLRWSFAANRFEAGDDLKTINEKLGALSPCVCNSYKRFEGLLKRLIEARNRRFVSS